MTDAGRELTEIADRFVRAEDPAIVVEAVRLVADQGPRARIARLANILHAVDALVGPQTALGLYRTLEQAGRECEYPEFLPILLHETAKVAHRSGRSETAASYALGAVRHALLEGQTVVAANVMRSSQRDGLL